MKRGNEFKSSAFIMNPRFNYLPEGDRYLMHRAPAQYRFNVIGTGINGQEHIANTLLEGRGEIYGVYDPNPGSIEGAKRRNEQYNGRKNLVVYDNLTQACNDSMVDGLIICTPNYTHIDIIREAVKSGKHIFVEKPMATTMADAYEMLQIAETYEAVFQIGLQYRYKAVYAEALYEILQRQTIGNVKLASIVEHRIPFLDKVNQWNKFSELSGGTLVEKCCHYFDLLNMVAQSRPASVYASSSQAVNFKEFEYDSRPSDIIDNALVIINYENGVRANFNLCMFSPMFYEEFVICGDRGRIKAIEHQSFQPNEGSKSTLEINLEQHRPSRVSNPSYSNLISTSGHHGATFIEHINFINNIEGCATDTATAAEGFWSIVVGSAAQESAKTGQIVDINEYLKANNIPL
ncbi:MAG: Gfo/Idh/MocA family oxidoreductase [Chloroflexota bacterium]